MPKKTANTKTRIFIGRAPAWIRDRDRGELDTSVRDAGRKLWLAGLGLVATVDHESRALFSRLVDRGQRRAETALEPVREAANRVQEAGRDVEQRVEKQVNSTVTSTLARLGVPTRDDIERLIARIEGLNRKIERQAAR